MDAGNKALNAKKMIKSGCKTSGFKDYDKALTNIKISRMK